MSFVMRQAMPRSNFGNHQPFSADNIPEEVIAFNCIFIRRQVRPFREANHANFNFVEQETPRKRSDIKGSLYPANRLLIFIERMISQVIVANDYHDSLKLFRLQDQLRVQILRL